MDTDALYRVRHCAGPILGEAVRFGLQPAVCSSVRTKSRLVAMS